MVFFNILLGSLLKLGTLCFPELVDLVFVARKHSNKVIVSNQNAEFFVPRHARLVGELVEFDLLKLLKLL